MSLTTLRNLLQHHGGVRFGVFLGVFAVVAVGIGILVRGLSGPVNPWKRFGVEAEWHHYGTTDLVEALYTTNFQGRAVTGTACPGANYDFRLRVEDTERDGIPEVIMENDKCRRVLAFRPANGTKPPEFITLSDSWPP